MDTPTTLLTGIAVGESPRWRGDRLWFSDWGARQIVVVRHDGQREITDGASVGVTRSMCAANRLHAERAVPRAGKSIADMVLPAS